MKTSLFGKTAVAMAVAGTFAATGSPPAEADVVYLSWRGAFTMLDSTGSPLANSPSDYLSGFYANGDGASTYGAPFFPGNVGPNADCTSYAPVCYTSHGWYGNRTPISGTVAIDVTNGAGVGTVNPFFFFGDTGGAGPGTQIASAGMTFQTVDTAGTIVGTMLFSWHGDGHSISMVLDGSGLLSNLSALIAGGPTSTLSGVGAIPATDGINFGTTTTPVYLPLGPAPLATKTLNALGCEAQSLATQVNAYTINLTGNIANCNLTQDDSIGGSPAVSAAFGDFNFNFDITSVNLEPLICPPSLDCPPPVPVPAAVWLFGSGLLGLVGLARRRKHGRK